MGIAGIGKRRDWQRGGSDLYWTPADKEDVKMFGTPDEVVQAQIQEKKAEREAKQREFEELNRSVALDDIRKDRDRLEKELRGAEMVIDGLHSTLNIAQHDTFKAEVEMRRAQQKRRNQKTELKRLHAAINEKNNRIRNLELEIGVLRGNSTRQLEMIKKQHDEISGLRVLNVRAE